MLPILESLDELAVNNLVRTYQQAIGFLFDRTNFERIPAGRQEEFKLGRMRRLLDQLDNPQSRLPCIHIAGTKGKGSTAVMIAEMLSAAGHRVGLYTSPHIHAFEERMRVAGQTPSADQVVDLVRRVQEAVWNCERGAHSFCPTFFEVTTALAWLFFESQQTELVVLEVGLGGRLDSTNVCSPKVCVLTTISRDHTQLLGHTLSQIAKEKAGIIKPRVPVISGVLDNESQSVIGSACAEHHAELWQLGREFSYEYSPVCEERANTQERSSVNRFWGCVRTTTPVQTWPETPLTLPGEHQGHNAAVAQATIDRLGQSGIHVAMDAAYRGMLNVRWPTRIEVVSQNPTVIVDSGHNWESIAALGRTLEEQFPRRTNEPRRTRRILIFAVSKDKDVTGLIRQLLPRFDSVILTQYIHNPRAVSAEVLLQIAQSLSDAPCHVASNPEQAWRLARRIAAPHDLICVTGSFYIASEMRELILREPSALV